MYSINACIIKEFIICLFSKQALWLHRRFLSLCWMKQFANDINKYELIVSPSNRVGLFIDNELHLLNSCSTVPDNEFEDFQAQATFSSTYILWLTKVTLFCSFGFPVWSC